MAALLRLQARRIDQPEARAALEEAVRRVGSIAIVHETLSQAVEETVDFDEIADRLGRMVTDVSAVSGRVRVLRDGAFGVLPSETATAMAMVLTEILQNAVEHGYPGMADVAEVDAAHEGRIPVSVRRIVGRLHVAVQDDGVGLPADFDPDTTTSLGLSIVRTPVESELGGLIEMGPANEGSGARVQIDVPMD
ncbi:sensor histidine kinase [Nocardioides sp. B-3]|uniref:sensor histidine kinase n=1 Tax=Nocardioides sp. B-3 TaxID=2895565 RepID=UPI002152F4AE|nr:sensor histidine kinase [Nocardioides sp. B-3]UUZ61747.1 sensor histidine kinase [Nocardioides sp. B-3]